jgi:metal-dependent HD superfamily phosphatase/phosphodiesterase
VDELLKRKLIGSGIEKYLKVNAYIKRDEAESLLLKEYKGG